MKGVLLLVISCFAAYSKALECGIGRVNSENIKQTLSTCIKNNETLERIWEMASAAIAPSSEAKESGSASMENDEPQVQSARKTRGSRIKRATSKPQIRAAARANDNRQENDRSMNSTEDPVPTENTISSGTADSSETCVVQCVFKQLGMTDDNGLPDHAKIVEGLLQTATGRELRVFLQESVDECFQQIDQENNVDPCAHSTQLVTCLANKGRMNCEDWPAGNLPF